MCIALNFVTWSFWYWKMAISSSELNWKSLHISYSLYTFSDLFQNINLKKAVLLNCGASFLFLKYFYERSPAQSS